MRSSRSTLDELTEVIRAPDPVAHRFGTLSSGRGISAKVVRTVPWQGLGAFLLVAGTGFAQGGYFPSSWGWPMLLAAWVAALGLLGSKTISVGTAGRSAIGCLTGFAAWTAASVVWSDDPTQTVLSAEHVAVYVCALISALVCARDRPGRLVAGAWAAGVVLCGWALLTRLVPDRWGVTDPISGYRLSEPIGYWNSLGLLGSMMALLGFGLAARGRAWWSRSLGAASVPLVLTTLYFTFSRGAWAALGVGLIAMFAIGPSRLQLLAVLGAIAAPTAFVIWRASNSQALNTTGFSMRAMAVQGHRMLPIVGGGVVVAAGLTLAVAASERGFHVPAGIKRKAGIGLACFAIAGVAAAFAVASPLDRVEHVWHEFATGSTSGGSLNNRLFEIGGNDRVALWHVAWRDAEAHPVLGSGAGTFAQVWFSDRTFAMRVRNAHDLYLETLAELGPIGLILLVGFLGAPFVALKAVRTQRFTVAAAGAYTAFVVHVIVDWDWQITTVTLVAVMCAAYLLSGNARQIRRLARRWLLTTAVVLVVLGIYTIASQIPLSRLSSALAHKNWAAAERDANQASAAAPWSEQPWLALGEGELNAGRLGAARTALRKAVGAAPDDWTPWLDLARASSGATRARALARAAALDPLEPAIVGLEGRR